jgi:hypothetical protein
MKVERLLIKDYENLPLFMKPKELKRIIPVSDPTLYALLNRTGCPKVYTGSRTYVVNTKRFIEWLNEQGAIT